MDHFEQHTYTELSPAIHGVNVPKGRVLESYIGNYYTCGVHNFNKIRSSEMKSSLPPHVPPDITLAINRPIFTYRKLI